MKTAAAFSDILELFDDTTDSVTPTSSASTSINAGWETVLDPAHLAQLMGHTSVFTTHAKSSPYKKFKTVYQRPTHTMTEEQNFAFTTLSQWAPNLKNNFGLKDLKSNYRLALLKTHPDQGGSSENFWAVKKSYEVLCSLVKS
jgi:hypothetical protein